MPLTPFSSTALLRCYQVMTKPVFMEASFLPPLLQSPTQYSGPWSQRDSGRYAAFFALASLYGRETVPSFRIGGSVRVTGHPVFCAFEDDIAQHRQSEHCVALQSWKCLSRIID